MTSGHQVPGNTGASGPPDVVMGRTLSDAERARTIAAANPTGVLATLARDPEGTPFGSVAPFGLDDGGNPVLCISELAEHTANLHNEPRASLLMAAPVAAGDDPLAAGRVTLLGRAALVAEHELDEARRVHLAVNPHAAGYIDYGDFSLWRLDVTHVRFVGGYGRMSWVTAEAWRAASPDPVAPFAQGVLDHLNADHADACLTIAQVLGGRPDARTAIAVSVDRYGLELDATGADGSGRVRLGFDTEAITPTEIRTATVALVRRARGAHL